MSETQKQLDTMMAEAERRFQAASNSSPVSADWLRLRYQSEGNGLSYEQWLETSVIRLATTIYRDVAADGLPCEDADAVLAEVFPTFTR